MNTFLQAITGILAALALAMGVATVADSQPTPPPFTEMNHADCDGSQRTN